MNIFLLPLKFLFINLNRLLLDWLRSYIQNREIIRKMKADGWIFNKSSGTFTHPDYPITSYELSVPASSQDSPASGNSSVLGETSETITSFGDKT